MKLLKFIKTKKDKKIYRNYVYRFSPNAQTSGSDLFLKKIAERKRGVRGAKVALRRHHGLLRKVVVFIVILLCLSFIVYKYNILNYFKVSNIEVEGASKFVSYNDALMVAEKRVKGQSIFFVNTDSLTEILKKNFLGAKKIEVEKKYPNKIKIAIEERVPIAVIYNEDEYFLLDSDGYVIGVVEEGYSNLPKIKYEDEISVGAVLEKDIVPVSIEILKFAEKENMKIDSLIFYPKYTKLYTGKDTEVLISYNKNTEESLRIVKALLEKSMSEEKTIKTIDLRYDKVIVLYD